MKKVCMCVLIQVLLVAFAYAEEARLLRQPHIHGDNIAFVYAGDLWTVSREGGVAKRLTSYEGAELFPKYSPDGKWIVFSGEYSGTRQIYLMPAEGGVPRQLTFYPDVGQMPPRGGWDNIPLDWTPDGTKILIKSNRTPYGQRVAKYFLVDPFNGGLEQPLQIPEGAFATFSPDGRKLAYSIKSREFRTWKRYKAGRAQDIWIYDLRANTIERVTTYPGTDNMPLWVGTTIYFTSDRDKVGSDDPRTLNMFAYEVATKNIRKVTKFNEFDCLWPSRGEGGVVFENGGYIYLMNPGDEQAKKITVEIFDDKPHMRPVFKNVASNIESYFISPSGKRAIFSARGDIFTEPAEHGNIRNVTESESIREMLVDWSPDGRYISYLSEEPGDYELFIQEYNREEPPVQLTKNTGCWITGYIWSPDSKKILLGDKMNRLFLIEVDSKKRTLIDTGEFAPIGSYTWSKDAQWVAYTKTAENYMSSIYLYSLEQQQSFQLTSDRTFEANPVFGEEGNYLYFISRRDFNYADRDFDARLYLGTLRADMPSPFAPRSDDEELPEEEKEKEKKSEEGAPEEEKSLEIDIDGFDQRIVALPLGTDNYRSLEAVKGGIVYLKSGGLFKFDLQQRKESNIMERASSFVLTAKEDKFLYRSGRDYGIAPLKPGQKPGTGRLDLSRMEMKITPAVEWKQIYTDSWRIMRDWFYDPGMHGVNWKKMHDKYEVLVPHVAWRGDLDYILGELIGELNAGHTYVNPGDMERVARVPVGTLGCELVADDDFYKIATIYPGENWDNARRNPLTEPGLNVSEGDYLIGIDGELVTTDTNPYKYLENKVGLQVTLLINSEPEEQGAREIVIRPVASELNLLHQQWLERNRAIVDNLSGGRIGYIYIANTSFEGFRGFYKGWVEQFDKDGLIIDERYNGGGSLPHPMIFDMAHPILQYWARRHLPLQPTPTIVNEGPKVMLINGRSSSGGDALPAYFRTMKLGPLMGQTTWGGLIGYSYSPSFVDGGSFAVPSFAYVNKEGEWDVEYYGVAPDIEVFDDPTVIQTGREPMLEEAVKYILEELRKNPPKKVKKPAGPKRN